MINSRIRRKIMAWGLGMAFAFSTVLPQGVVKAYEGYDSELHFSWTNEGVSAEEQNRFETYGHAANSYMGTRPDGSTGSIQHTFALMIDHNKVWGSNVAHNEGGHEKRYTSSVDEVYDFSNEFGAKAFIMIVPTGEYITIPDTVSNRSLKAGTTIISPVRNTARFRGADINCEPGVRFEALEYESRYDGVLYGIFDIRSSLSHIVGSGLQMIGNPDYFIRKDYTVTQSGEYAVDVTINRGQAIGNASLTGDAVKWSAEVDGAWSFADGSTVPEVGTHTYDVVFSPTWNVDYVKKTFTGKGRVTVVDGGSGAGGSGAGGGAGTGGSGSGSGSGGGSGAGGSGTGSSTGGGSGAGGSGSGTGTDAGSGSGSGTGSGTGGSGSGTGSGAGTGGSGSGSGTGSGSGSGTGGGSGAGGTGTGNQPAPSADPYASVAPETSASPKPTGLPGATGTPLPTGSPDAATGPAASLVEEPELEPPIVIEKIVSDISKISSADRPSKVKTTYVSRVGSTFTVKVLKVTKKKPTGYQIQYTTNKKSWKGARSKKFKKLKMTVKGLMGGRTYYFRIRAYRKVKGQTVYGKWSKRKKI